MRKVINGIDASPGVVVGKAFLYEEIKLVINKGKVADSKAEEEKLLKGRTASKEQLLVIREMTANKLGEGKAAIFDGHITMLEDEDFFDDILDLIQDDKLSAEYALEQVLDENCEMLANLEDPYLREREADLRDIGRRWLFNTTKTPIVDLGNLPPETVIIANDLTPSDTAQVDLVNTVAFVTQIGGKTAHTSIMARSLELPAVVGTKTILSEVKKGETMIVDAMTGEIIINPTVEEITKALAKKAKYKADKEELKKLLHKTATSKDGVTVGAWANIGGPTDVAGVLNNGADGIGLYRTEFLFMNSTDFPTEDEQFAAYKEVVEKMGKLPVTIRTMDIGGDKALSYMDLPEEENPFLGWRALRVCLDRPEILKTQFRALLRASGFGYVKIMLPMIISIEEVRKSRELLEVCMAELKSEGVIFDEKVQLGIMVETPAVAFRAKYFAKEVDFFSIGTNDLTQYTLAVDRGNEKISALYDSFNPGVLAAIKMAIEGAHEGGISISMCGEFAGDELATPILFGMGLDAFSMSAISVLGIKKTIINLDKKECEALVERVMAMSTADEIRAEIRKFNESL
ncbi:MAG: phosphoenolpyruvate--protein phosphotransferase [Psychrilyobacter sp.]|nr:phosphoenolpyruvate--protein phosphotransferase [Psychrilyobacter sp.]